MKVGFDLRPLVLGAGGGIAVLAKQLLEHVIRLHPQHQFLVFCTPFNRGLIEIESPNTQYFCLPVATYARELDRIAAAEALDILFRTYPTEDAVSFPESRQIYLIPDIQHEVYPQFFDAKTVRARRRAFARALRSAGAIATISTFAIESLRAFRDTRCKDIFLVEPGPQFHADDASVRRLEEKEQVQIPPGPFFLFPANLWQHKNHRVLLEAFKIFCGRGNRNVSLVLTGHAEGWQELARDFAGLPVRHLGFVRPEMLRMLFEKAHALVFFSLYEGFGMPVLEAFDAGLPVICSSTTSLPEVGGDAVLTCDPADPAAIVALMERICTDQELRATLVARGKIRLRQYSWAAAARTFVESCERVHARLAAPSPSAELPLNSGPLVSIVTPSFNQGRFLRRTIESVLSQNYARIEYQVVDGGSTDDSLEVLRSFGDRFTWVSEPDRGQTHAINKGMVRVSGEILAYLNSDDVLLPGAIRRVVTYFRDHPNCDAVYGDADHIDENDAFIDRYPTAEYSFDRLVENCMVCQPAMFWRRRVADRVGPFDEQLNYTMDYDYWFRMARAGANIHYLPEKLACSRLHEGAKTLSAKKYIYPEILKTSKKHAGRVHKRYFDGYWHYLIQERQGFLSRFVRKFPGWDQELSWIHFHWFNRHNYPWKVIAHFVAVTLPKHYFNIAVQMLPASLRFSASPPPPRSSRVAGFWHDSWFSPEVRIGPLAWPLGEPLYIGGVAPVDLEMHILAGSAVIGTFRFEAHRYKRVSFTADLLRDNALEIRSSAYMVDAANRRLSFLLQDTNAFSEQDLT
jgi:glycosyltransferase involved in cell wall biosynthesis